MSHNVEHIHLVRSVQRRFGALDMIFWYGGGQCFTGRGSHLLALQAARLAQHKKAAKPEKARATCKRIRRHLRVIRTPRRRSAAQLRRSWNNMAQKVIQVCVRISA